LFFGDHRDWCMPAGVNRNEVASDQERITKINAENLAQKVLRRKTSENRSSSDLPGLSLITPVQALLSTITTFVATSRGDWVVSLSADLEDSRS
jgi:hypothetical protein